MMQTSSPRLLIVDHDGKILHHLTWDAEQYVVADEVTEDALDGQEMHDDSPAVVPTPEASTPHAKSATQPITVTQGTAVTVALPSVPLPGAAGVILQELKRAYEPLQDAVLVTATGTVLAATSDAAGAMMCEVVVALMDFGMQATQTLDMGEMTQLTSRDEQMLSILYPATNGAALGVSTASAGNLGLLYRGCQRALQRLAAQR